jgi:hypothetical protein
MMVLPVKHALDVTVLVLGYQDAGGSTSGARGVRSGDVPGPSTCDLRSAALSNRAAEISGSLVALANPNRVAA